MNYLSLLSHKNAAVKLKLPWSLQCDPGLRALSANHELSNMTARERVPQ